MELAPVLWGIGKGWGRTILASMPAGRPEGRGRASTPGGLHWSGLGRRAAGAVGSWRTTYQFVSRLERDRVPRFPGRPELMREAYARASREGLLLEFGVYKGASINRLADLAQGRSVYGFDSFEGLPEDWVSELARGAFSTGGQLPPVRPSVQLVKGLFQATLEPFLREHPGPAALVHLDADLMASTKYVLETLTTAGRLADGTVVVFDDFYGWSNRYQNGDYAAWYSSAPSHRPYRFIGFVMPPGGHVALRLGPT